MNSEEIAKLEDEIDRMSHEMEGKENEWRIVDESWQKHVNALEQDIQQLTRQVTTFEKMERGLFKRNFPSTVQ